MTTFLVRHGHPVQVIHDYYEPKRASGLLIGALRRSRIGRRTVPAHEAHQWFDCDACMVALGVVMRPWQRATLRSILQPQQHRSSCRVREIEPVMS